MAALPNPATVPRPKAADPDNIRPGSHGHDFSVRRRRGAGDFDPIFDYGAPRLAIDNAFAVNAARQQH